MIIVSIIFLTLAICFIAVFNIFVVGVNACSNDKGDDTTITPEEARKVEDALYLAAMSCKKELQMIY